MTAVKTYDAVKQHADRIVNSEPQSLRMMLPGDEWRQGDLRIVRLPYDFDESQLTALKEVPTQLVPGNTQGSRHLLADVRSVRAYSLQKANALDGLILHLLQPNAITHPEHGDCVDLQPGWYAFPGQRTFAEELRRVQD